MKDNINVQKVIDKLETVFKTNKPDYFFTEKELHSYFLKLCLDEYKFEQNGYLLVHAEYPTPFKCSYNKQDVIRLEDDGSNRIRAHIDMVIINPNYIEWILQKNYDVKFISGIKFSPMSRQKFRLFKVY